MSIKYLAFVLFFSLTAIYPVHKNFGNLAVGGSGPDGKNGTDSGNQSLLLERYESSDWMDTSTGYLWIYVVFVYLFSGAALYLIFTETKKVIQVRQKHLGAQSSISDRTIRLSGIPAHLRSETKIKETVENLQIGKVESVTLCRNWRELDNLVEERIRILKKLESALIDHQGPQTSHSRLTLGPLRHRVPRNEDEDDDEQTGLLENGENEQDHVTPVSGPRPTTRFWYGFLGLQNRKVDAIDYYEERLKVLDGRIEAARRKEYTPMPLAFVTLDSIAACVRPRTQVLPPADFIQANGYSGHLGSRAHATDGKCCACTCRCRLAEYLSFTSRTYAQGLVYHFCRSCSHSSLDLDFVSIRRVAQLEDNWSILAWAGGISQGS